MISVKATRDESGKLLTAEVADYAPDHEDRNDWKTFEAAEEIAAALNRHELGEGWNLDHPSKMKTLYIAVDAGQYVSPRYDVIRLPQIGDDVSYAFNGDSYPCGKITKISKGPDFRQVTAGPDFTGKFRVFYRRRRSAAWVNAGTWHLISGHVNERNPSF